MAKGDPTKKQIKEQRAAERDKVRKEKHFEKRAQRLAHDRVMSMQRCRKLMKRVLARIEVVMFPSGEKHIRPSDRGVDLARRMIVAIGTDLMAGCAAQLPLTRLQRVNEEMVRNEIARYPHRQIFRKRHIPIME